jgi:hypothetical protein
MECTITLEISMENNYQFGRSFLLFFAVILISFLLTACQNQAEFNEVTDFQDSSIPPLPSATQLVEVVPMDTSPPAKTISAVESLTSPGDQILETVNSNIAGFVTKPTLNPCYAKLEPVDIQYSNPQENLDPRSETTWMTITVDEGILSAQDSYHYWWDTRAFSGDLSFNVGDGSCTVLIETNQIKCERIPLSGTDNLSTGGYEYDFKIYIQNYDCSPRPNYQQRGLIYMKTMKHTVFQVNGEDVP